MTFVVIGALRVKTLITTIADDGWVTVTHGNSDMIIKNSFPCNSFSPFHQFTRNFLMMSKYRFDSKMYFMCHFLGEL